MQPDADDSKSTDQAASAPQSGLTGSLRRRDRGAEPRAIERRRIGRAILGALLLLGWNTTPDASPRIDEPATPPVSAPLAASSMGRDQIVRQLRQRNPALGSTRALRIADAVLSCTETQQIPDLTPELVLSIMFRESGARPHAVSPKGAVGLMQVMPYMYRVLELPGGIANLESNVEAGCLLLADNIRRLGRERGILTYFWGSDIRGDEYLRGVESILQGISEGPTARVESGRSEPG